ncbi:hypothetical protein EDB87DRAFT_1765767 [Lactarius vividus]|nr:hypothetical protein EDB87DRAFT_1765767 [Lactarius vividus]
MSPISPADSNIVPRREFIRDQHPASSFSILALSGAALLRLYSFPPDAVLALRKHLDSAHLILSSREHIQNNFCELSLDGKPWSNPKSTRTEKLLMDILYVLYRNDYNFLSTLDYGREQDDRLVMAFSRPSSLPPPPPFPAPPLAPFHKKSNDSLTVVPHPTKVPFAISFISQNVLRVIAPPLHLTPAILQTVRGSWPRGVVSEKKVAENVYEFKFKGYGWFQEDTFATDSLRHILSLLSSLDVFGFTLLTSLSLNGRSRFKDLWVFLGLSQTIPTESRPSSPLGTDIKASSERIRGRRGSYPVPANSPPSSNPRGHTRAASSNNISSTGPTSSKSGVMRKPAPRAQLPVSVAQSTVSNDNIPDPETPTQRAEELRMELQSSVGSAVDMTGIGTHKFGHGPQGEPDESVYQRMPSRLYGNFHFPGTSAPVVKAPQTGGPLRGAQPFGGATRRLDAQPTTREANPHSRSRPSPQKSASQQSGTPTPPLLGPGAFRDSAISSNTSQTVDVPIAWTGVGKENGHSGSGPRSRDPKENALPGGWISARIKESNVPGDPNESHRHKHAMPPLSQPEEQEVKAATPELVYPKLRPAKSGKATLVTEPPRPELHGARAADRLPAPAPGMRDHNPAKVPAEGWVLVNVGHPGVPGAPPPQVTNPLLQHGLQRKRSFPPMSSQRPPPTHSPYSTGSRGVPAGLTVGGHKKGHSTYNPSSMSPAAKAIVVFDAIEAKRKAATGDTSQSGFRKFFSLTRPDSPGKSSGKERKLLLSGGGSKSKLLEQEDGTDKREGAARERWRTRGTPEGRKSHRRMSVD